jgi:hypothetical protein
MGIRGTFGYIIGKKKRLTHVSYDADYLFDVLMRELFVLLKHYKTLEALQVEFEKIKVVNLKNKPKQEDIEKCKYFTDLDVSQQSTEDWYCLLRGCQASFINLLQAGFLINQKKENGYVVILDFNTKTFIHYCCDHTNIIKDYYTMEEVLHYHFIGGAPTKTFVQIVTEFKENFDLYYDEKSKIDEKIKKANDLLLTAKNVGDQNIIHQIEFTLKKYQFMLNKLKRDNKTNIITT